MAAATICAASAFATAPSGTGDTCPRGSTCVYDRSGNIIYRNAGNGSIGGITPGKVWNNGYRDPGFDHITLTVVDDVFVVRQICLHYGPNPSPHGGPTVAWPVPVTSWVSWKWRAECKPGEDSWRITSH